MKATMEDKAGGASSESLPSGGGDRTRTDDPLLAKQVLSQLSYTPGTGALTMQAPFLVGLGRFELPTSRLSGVRSNRLSYRPGSVPRRRTAGQGPIRPQSSDPASSGAPTFRRPSNPGGFLKEMRRRRRLDAK